MPLQGTLEADFSPFIAETQKANTALKVFLDTGTAVGTSLDKVSTKGTGNVAALGQAAVQATPQISRLHTSLATFDSLLGSVGVSITPAVRAIGEIGAISGQTFSQLGLVGTAGAALGAGIAGWNIGRAIAEFFDLDRIIAATATDIGLFGNAAAEAAGAKADSLALATKRAGREITSLSEAIKINAQWFQDWQHQHGAFNNAIELSTADVAKWRHEIDLVKTDGNFESLTKALESQGVSLKTLSERYGLSIEALQFMQRAAKDTKDRIKELDDEIIAGWKNDAEAAKILEDVEIKFHKGYLDRFKAETEAQQKKTSEINTVVVDGAIAIRKVQEDAADAIAKTTLSSSDYQIREIWRVVGEQERAFKGSAEQRAAYYKLIEGMAATNAAKLIALELTTVVGHGPDVPLGGLPSTLGGGLHPLAGLHPLQGFASGGPVLQDGPIYAHAGEFVVPKGGGGNSVTNIYVTQPLGTPRAIAAAVDAALSKSMKQGRQWPSN